MSGDRARGSDAFEPQKYLTSLIAAVNDGAKAAQAGALVFALVGVYLLATAFSASDEDLLRGRGVTISQIGATLPVSFSFAIAPFVFVFLQSTPWCFTTCSPPTSGSPLPNCGGQCHRRRTGSAAGDSCPTSNSSRHWSCGQGRRDTARSGAGWCGGWWPYFRLLC